MANLSDLAKMIEQRKQAMVDAAGAAVYQAGVQIAGDAMEEAPVDTGFMRNSVYVRPPQINGMSVSTSIGFGAEYWVAVHERTKPFLTIAIDKNKPRMQEIFEVFFRRAMEDGKGIRPQQSSMPGDPDGGRAAGGG